MTADFSLLTEAASRLVSAANKRLDMSKCESIADFYRITRTMKIFDDFTDTSLHELTLVRSPTPKDKIVDKVLNKKVGALERAISRFVLLYSQDALSFYAHLTCAQIQL